MKGLSIRILGLAAAAVSFAYSAPADAVAGRWDASLVTKTSVVPFRLDISGDGPTLKGTLYNGWDPFETTTRAKFENGTLVLAVEHYLVKDHGDSEGRAA
jgi:hypothetical protein